MAMINAKAARKALPVLTEALKSIKIGWTQNAYARTAAGEPCDSMNEFASCFCISGAVNRCVGSNAAAAEYARGYLRHVVPCTNLAVWNDQLGRTQAEVIDAFQRAIAIAHTDALTCAG